MFNISWGLQIFPPIPYLFPYTPPIPFLPPPPAVYFGDVAYFLPAAIYFGMSSMFPSQATIYFGMSSMFPSHYLFWDVIFVPITPSRCLLLPSCHHVACSFHHAITLPVPSIMPSRCPFLPSRHPFLPSGRPFLPFPPSSRRRLLPSRRC